MKTISILLFCLFAVCRLWGGQFEYKNADTTILFQSPCDIDSTNIKCRDLAQLIPNDLKFYRGSGQPNGITYFGIYYMPMTDSVGQLYGPSCSDYNVILALNTNFDMSLLVVYKYEIGRLIEIWRSDIIDCRGTIEVEDLNSMPGEEIILDLTCPPHEYQNNYFLYWDKDGIHVLNPSGKMQLLSEFTGYVDRVKSDSGFVIQSYHPSERIARTYILKKGTQKITLVSEKKVMKKE
jgi:hypothetical protein